MMHFALVGSIVVLALNVAWAPVSYAAEPVTTSAATSKKSRLLFQVSDNDPGKWNLALNNANNVQKDVGAGNVDIEIVVYGPGIGMLKADSVAANRVNDALASGVKVVACENTMQAQKLSKADMMPSIGYVSAGVVELMQKQQEGWAYIKP
jgi:intracellular sulfur oxidation DsrE/DsrF family protein